MDWRTSPYRHRRSCLYIKHFALKQTIRCNVLLKERNLLCLMFGVDSDTFELLSPTLIVSLVGMVTTITTPSAGAAFVLSGLYGLTKVTDSVYIYVGLSDDMRRGQTLVAVNVDVRIQF